MKGQQKISRGSGFRGALNYDFSHDNARLLCSSMFGTDPRSFSCEFSISRKMRPDVEKPVWRNVLSFPNGEKPSDEKLREIVNAYLEEMGFDLSKTQFCAVIHDKPGQYHVHITASRIMLDGSLFLGKNENLRSTKIIAKLECRFGLQPTKQAEIDPSTGLPSISKSKKNPKKGEIEKALRTGLKPPRLAAQEAIDQALLTARTEADLVEELKKSGWLMEVKMDDFGKIVGVTFQQGDSKFGGSKLGRDYMWPSITDRLERNRNGERAKKNAASPESSQRPRPDETGGVTRKIPGRTNRGSEKNKIPSVGFGSLPISRAEEERLVRLSTRCRIICISSLPLIPYRKGYRDWIGRDGRVWLFYKSGHSAGLAFKQTAKEKILEFHRPTAALTESDADAFVRLAVDSGMQGPLIIEGDAIFIKKIKEAARRLNVPVQGDPVSVAPVISKPTDNEYARGRSRME